MATTAQQHHEKKHATAKQYIQLAVILTVITIVEVAYPYATESLTSLHNLYMPLLGVMSLVKFFLVVGFYMHLYYDIVLLKQIFLFSLLTALLIGTALLFLFHIF